MPTPADKKVVVIGQAPARPGSKHETPGTYLGPWLRRIGLSEAVIDAQFTFAALIGEFPGSKNGNHLPPTREQILSHQPELRRILAATQPQIVIPVGRLATAELLQNPSPLDAVIGQACHLDPLAALSRNVCVIPLPHPSGRSTWLHQHGLLLDRALELLANELAS